MENKNLQQALHARLEVYLKRLVKFLALAQL